MSKQIRATAEGLASLGRGPDRVLVHMSPKELSGLQSLAQAHGTSLTLHPKTGLPEAGVLDSILPMIAGIAVTAMTGGTAMAAYAPMLAAMAGAGTKAATTGQTDLGTLASGALGGHGGAGLGDAIGKLGAAATPGAQAGAAVGGVGAPVGTNTVLRAGEAAAAAPGQTAGQSIVSNAMQRGISQGAPPLSLPAAGGATTGQNMMAGARAFGNEPMKGLASLNQNMTMGQKVGVGATVLDAMTSAGSGGGKGKNAKPTWYMYGDAQTPGFDQNTQRYGPATTTQDPQQLQNYLLAQSAMKPPAPPPVKVAKGGTVARPVSLQDYYAVGGDVSGGRFISGPGDGVSDSIPAQIDGQQPAALGSGEFVLDARTVSEIGNGSSEAGSQKLYAMMDRIQQARKKATIGEDSGAARYLPA
jgi:hypothetical protein